MERGNRCYCALTGLTGICGENDNDVESVDNDEFFGYLFNQSAPKKDKAAKRIEGFLSAVPAKKIDDIIPLLMQR